MGVEDDEYIVAVVAPVLSAQRDHPDPPPVFPSLFCNDNEHGTSARWLLRHLQAALRRQRRHRARPWGHGAQGLAASHASISRSSPLRPHRLGSARIFSHGELAPTLGKIRDPFCQMAIALSDSIITSALLKVISLTYAYSEDTMPVAPLAVSLHCEVP